MKKVEIKSEKEFKSELALLKIQRAELAIRLGELQATFELYGNDEERREVCKAWSKVYNRIKELESN
jgi:hypothetical protein